ncbi:MAG: peptide chain release factor N(5)-glutamine methyltransferase [Chloroflexi bacterium]|nr:MAG: peptide chain release factor N(5)-glutamine methyltransferase [Chloroflexota bacterium]
MNVLEALRQARRLLPPVSDEPELEAELLLRHCLGVDRASLYRLLTAELSDEEQQRFRDLVRRRLIHEPTAYIIGHKEFFGLDFEVTPAALIPRPETEVLVELAIEAAHKKPLADAVSIADVGTGSGAIAVALASALPEAKIRATDTSPDAIELAQRNARRHGAAKRISFLQTDLLDKLTGQVDVLVANLPYVTTTDWKALPPEIRDHEPREALDGGPGGLRVIKRLLEQAPDHLKPSGVVLAEIGDNQGRAAREVARAAFPDAAVKVMPDLSGRDRVLVVQT